jgi:hypothetical protein
MVSRGKSLEVYIAHASLHRHRMPLDYAEIACGSGDMGGGQLTAWLGKVLLLRGWRFCTDMLVSRNALTEGENVQFGFIRLISTICQSV